MASNRVVLWAAFVAVHVWLGMLCLFGPGFPLGDVTVVYRRWVDQIVLGDYWVGVDAVWVYPVLAIAPMLAAFALGPELYASVWLCIVIFGNAVGFAAITGWATNRRRAVVGWWWIGFLALLGPIALARIDAVTVPLAIVGVLLLAARPAAAAVVLALATWVKVWPAALLAAIVIASRHRRDVVLAAVAVSVGVVLTALLFGSGANVFSFVGRQTGRGLQVESPVGTLWLWQALLGSPTAGIYYDREILTYQLRGDGVAEAAALMTPALGAAALAVAGLGVWAVRRGAHADRLLAPLALALVATLIVFNKVGSPQFVSWLAVPVVLGLCARLAGSGRTFRVPATLAFVVAALTQSFYPYLYNELLALNPALVVAVTARNLLMLAVLAWAVREVVVVARSPHALPPQAKE